MSTILSWYSKVPFNIPRLFHVLFERLIPIQLILEIKIVDKEISIQLLSISYFFSYRNTSSWCTSQSALTRRPTTVTRRDSPEAWWPRARLGHRDQRGDHWRMMVFLYRGIMAIFGPTGWWFWRLKFLFVNYIELYIYIYLFIYIYIYYNSSRWMKDFYARFGSVFFQYLVVNVHLWFNNRAPPPSLWP